MSRQQTTHKLDSQKKTKRREKNNVNDKSFTDITQSSVLYHRFFFFFPRTNQALKEKKMWAGGAGLLLKMFYFSLFRSVSLAQTKIIYVL